MLNWISPDKELPPVKARVLIAVGVRELEIEEYQLAKVGGSGAFYVSNGTYSDNCLYSKNSPHHTDNKYRVMAWAEFNECDVDLIKTHCTICGDYHDKDSVPLSCKTGDGE